jgi:SAM-dependent methyltransferase
VSPDDPARSRPGVEDPAAEKLVAPSAARNAPVIAETLRRTLGPEGGAVLEVGAGTGQHAVACAAALPGRRWIATDPDAAHLGSIAAWAAEAALPTLAPPLRLDATADGDWDAVAEAAGGPVDAVYSANVIHIAPWSVAEGLVRGAAALLAAGGRLILYGPFLERGAGTDGNLAFDRSLRARDPAWGVRDLFDVTALAVSHGFGPPRREAMPANNLILLFPKLGAGPGGG